MKAKMARILIIEDDANIRDIIRIVLSKHYELIFATNGQEALNLFGIYKVGDLINIDPTSINRRFGNHIIKRVRQVLGKETELFNKIVWEEKYSFSTELFLEEITLQGIS